MRAWGNAPGSGTNRQTRALKARFNGRDLVPNETLIEIDPMPSEQVTVFLLECSSPVVLFLRVDIFQNRWQLTRTHRERPYPRCQKKPR